jgi:hypothetical protein
MSEVESFSSSRRLNILAYHHLGLLREQPPTTLAVAKPLRNASRCRIRRTSVLHPVVRDPWHVSQDQQIRMPLLLEVKSTSRTRARSSESVKPLESSFFFCSPLAAAVPTLRAARATPVFRWGSLVIGKSCLRCNPDTVHSQLVIRSSRRDNYVQASQVGIVLLTLVRHLGVCAPIVRLPLAVTTISPKEIPTY